MSLNRGIYNMSSFHKKALEDDRSIESEKYDVIKGVLRRLGKRHVTTSNLSEKIDLESQITELENNKKEITDKIVELESQIEHFSEENKDTQDPKESSQFNDLETEKADLKKEAEFLTQEIQEIQESQNPNTDETSTNEEFGKLIVRRDANNSNSQQSVKFSETNKVAVNSLFVANEPIENTLLYAATFFPELTPYEFNQVVLSLLANRTIKVEKESQVVTDQGKVRAIKTEEVKSLSLVWEESLSEPDTYLKKCHLKAIEIGRSRVIDFDIPNLRNEMKIYLKEEQPLYLDNLLGKTQLFIFHPYIQVAKGGIEILVDAMLTHPTVYDENWILRLVQELTQKEDWTIDQNLDLEQQVQKFLRELESASRRKVVFTRISGLLYFMLSSDRLKLTVKPLLDKLMSHGRYDAVIAIVNELETVDEFDEFCWLKQLLDNGDEDARIKAYKLLYRKLKMSGFRIYERLEKLQSWLPSKDRNPSNYSHANRAALRVLIDYCSDTISKLSENDYGSYPSKYPLFIPFQKGEVEQKFRIVLNWLFYPSPDNKLVIENILEDSIDAISFLGSLIAEWFTILSGLDGEASSESLVAIEIMLQQVIACSSRTQQKELSQFWTNFTEYLLVRINQQSDGGGSEMKKNKKKLTRRRNLVRKLNKQFKSLQQVA